MGHENVGGDLEKQMLILHDHEEKHFMSSEIIRDVILGVSDGLTVPFALAAGLSGADISSSIILIAGIAEVAAGAISMGLGGYLAAKSEEDDYKKELKREQDEIIAVPEIAPQQSAALFLVTYIRASAPVSIMLKQKWTPLIYLLKQTRNERHRKVEASFARAKFALAIDGANFARLIDRAKPMPHSPLYSWNRRISKEKTTSSPLKMAEDRRRWLWWLTDSFLVLLSTGLRGFTLRYDLMEVNQ